MKKPPYLDLNELLSAEGIARKEALESYLESLPREAGEVSVRTWTSLIRNGITNYEQIPTDPTTLRGVGNVTADELLRIKLFCEAKPWPGWRF